jgi:6-phosphogluconolactonase (cycloisomerase 2 family)
MQSLINRKAVMTFSLLAIFAQILFFAPANHVNAASAAITGNQDLAAGRSFVYTITNPNGANAIAAYERNTQTGELTFRATYVTGGRGSGSIIDTQSPLVVNAEGTFLYAVNVASNDISVMAIRQNGALEIVGVFASRGVEPSSLALNGDLLYVANKGDGATPPNYTGFRVNADGTLGRIKRRVELNIGDNPTQILFNKAGDMLIGLRFGGRIVDCFTVVRQNGRLRPLAQLNNQTGPFAGAFNPVNDSQLIVSDARLPGAVSYSVSGQGVVNQITAVRNAPNRAACWIAIHNNGVYAWVANTGTNTLSLYTINGDGSLNLIGDHSTLAFGRAPFEIVLDRNGQFLYELNTGAGNQSIHVLRVTGGTTDGGLADVATVSLPAGSAPAGLVVVE